MATDAETLGPRDPVGRLVQRDPVMVAEKLTLRAVAAVLSGAGIGAALVDCGDGTLGIVSERDIVRALADDADPDEIWSADVMTEDLVVADVSEPILQVALRMLDEGIRHIAIGEGDDIVGVVSARDVFAVLAEDAIARASAA